MMLLPHEPIWFYAQPVDFRKQLDGLVHFIADHLQMNPASGQWFIFRNRSSSKIKIICWDRNGFWLFYKRLEKGRFRFPGTQAGALELTRDQFNWLLSGLDCLQYPLLPTVTATNFC